MKHDPHAKALANPLFRQRKKPSKREIRTQRRNAAMMREALFEIALDKEEREEREGEESHARSCRYPGC